jgi:CBS domain-containing protein
MIVKNILPRALERLAVIEAGAPVREAAALMSKPHTDLIVVCDHGDMVGVLTKTDIVGQISRCMGSGCTAKVDSIMTRDVTYCRTHEALLDVWSLMRERGLQRVPILRRPLGIIYAREALQALLSTA